MKIRIKKSAKAREAMSQAGIFTSSVRLLLGKTLLAKNPANSEYFITIHKNKKLSGWCIPKTAATIIEP